MFRSNLRMAATSTASPGWPRRHGRTWKVRMAEWWRVAVMMTMQGIASTESAPLLHAPDRQWRACWRGPCVSQRRTVAVPLLPARARPSRRNVTLRILLVLVKCNPTAGILGPFRARTTINEIETVPCSGTMALHLSMTCTITMPAVRLASAPWTRICRTASPCSALAAPSGRLGLCWRCCSAIGHVGQARIVFGGKVGI